MTNAVTTDTHRNAHLDIWKGIAALMVVFIHIRFPGQTGEYVTALARFAVPLFFAIAGRYLLPGEGEGTGRCLGKAAHTLRTAILATLVYTLYSLGYHLFFGQTLRDWLLSKYTPREWGIFLLFNSGRILYDDAYTYDHLWFLWALVYVYLCLALACRTLGRTRLVSLAGPCAAILLAGLYFGQALRIWYPVRAFGVSISEWYILRNWLFVGLPFTLLGIWHREAARRHTPLRDPRIGGYMILGGALLTLLTRFLLQASEVPAGALLMVLGILTRGCQRDGSTGRKVRGTVREVRGTVLLSCASQQDSRTVPADFPLTSDRTAPADFPLTSDRTVPADFPAPWSIAAVLGERYSAGVYYSHVLVGALVTNLVYYHLPSVWASPVYDWTLPLIVAALSLFVTSFNYRIAWKRNHGNGGEN